MRSATVIALCVSLTCASATRAQTADADRKPAVPLASLPLPKAGGALRILLVDDNGSPNNIAGNTHRDVGSDQVYRELVATAVGGDANAWSLEIAPYRKDGPAFERLRHFNVVVWYTGDSYGADADTLSKQDEDTVRRYLQETGGTFVLISPGYVNNLVYGATWQRAEYPFLTEVMGVNGVAPLAQRFAAGRVDSSGGTGFPVSHPGVAETQFSAVNSNGAAVLFTSTLDPARTAEGPVPVAVANAFAAGRFVYVGFTLENIPAVERANAFSFLLDAGTGRAVTSRVARTTTAAPTTPAPTTAVNTTAAMATPAATMTRTPAGSPSGITQLSPGAALTPEAVNPAPDVVITGPAVRFQWRGPEPATPVRYEICVSEAGLACSASTSVVFKLSGTPLTEVTLENRTAPGPVQGPGGSGVPTGTPGKPPYFYPTTLPYSLQGKRLQWSVTACASNSGTASLPGRSAERCGSSSPRFMTWALQAPTLGSPGDNLVLATVDRRRLNQPTFAWNYGNTQGVEFFRFCVVKPGVTCPTKPGVQKDALAIDLPGSLSTTLTQNLTPFLGKTLHWTVAACNSALGCAYPPSQRRLQVPLLLGSYDAIHQVMQNDKCMNCHEMHLENAVYLRHVALGRFTREEISPRDTSDRKKAEKCSTCHTAATGFTDHWRAPGRALGMVVRGPMSGDVCANIRRGEDYAWPDQVAHMKRDPDVLWAVDKIPGVGVDGWQELLVAWDRTCPCGDFLKTNCNLRGQFIP